MEIEHDVLSRLPLHTITDRFGPEGLRARFMLEIDQFDPLQRRSLTAALGLAAELHRDDRRVTEPYLNHVLRVATRLISHYQVDDPEVVIAGLLHDSVEDHAPELAAAHPRRVPGQPAGTPDEVPGRALGTIGARFGSRVARLVAAVTNPAYSADRDPDEQYREHLATSLAGSPWARVIKASDFTDNGVGVIHTTGAKALRAAVKYHPVVPMLRDLIGRPDTPLSPAVKDHIFGQLDLAEERFRQILTGPTDD